MSEMPHSPDCLVRPCRQCALILCITRYMLRFMDPTDRALRPAGDIYPAGSDTGNGVPGG